LFGSGSTSNSTFGGGFGATNNTTSAFGGGNTGGGIFGQNKPAGFGSTNPTTGTGGLFGGGNTSGGFGANNTTGGFGASTAGGFGANSNTNTNNGTAGPPFQPFTEKDPGAANGSAQYQTITFQQPYSNYSLEELRSVDYAQGRRYGNQNGQAGAFGQSTGFGGFGANNNTTNTAFGANNTSTGGGLFGGQNNTASTPFGSNTNSAFGSNNNSSTSGGGVFGQNKPAGGLFGASTTTPQPGTTGGLFGSTSNATTSNPFGATSTNNAFGASTGNTGGGLFGQNNAAQNKPAFGGFGSNTSTTNSNPFGGSATNTGGGLFGQQNQASSTPAFGGSTQTSTNTGGGLFGNNSATNATNTGSLFGQNQQAQSQSTGGLFGGGLGQNNQNQQKPSLFGGSATNTGGGLFGGAQQNQTQSGGAFGQNKTGGGLFGGAPSQPSGGLFGSSTTNTSNTGGGLFGGLGSQNNQQNSGNTLFGASNNQQKPGSLFGGSTTTNTNSGGGLFSGLNQSNNNSAPLGGSLLGGNQSQQQPNQQPMNNSLFGASANSLLNTSMTTNPYGNDPLFAGLSTPLQSPGPLATPLSNSQKNKRSAILPQHKLNPSQSTRLLTPQGMRNGGYGFTYSTYGTPSSTQSSPLGGSMFNSGSLSRHLGKSLSSSNLRNSFTAEASVLAPGAFAMTGRPYGTGSLKKLNLNRNLNQRPALFEEPAPKRVSFVAASPEVLPNSSTTNGELSSPSNALVVRDDVENVSLPGIVNGTSSSRKGKSPEMEQVNGVDLTPVPENRTLQPRTSASLNVQNGQTIDPTPGGYWSEPSVDTLKKMSAAELKSISNFVVGRDKVGKIEFNYSKPVDLSSTPLDKLFGDIISLNHRNATVYGDTCTVAKPSLGSGLNQPSRITMGNSWPRGTNRAGKQSTKHVERLKRVNGTSFENYDNETGEWVFGVPHFSSYGFEYDQPEDLESSELSPVPETPARLGSSQMTSTPQDSIPSATQSSPDDTFDFKRGLSKRTNVPGQFDDDAVYEEEDDEEMEETPGESFLGARSVGSLDGQDEYLQESESESVEDQDMSDSVSGPIRTTEQDIARQADPFKDVIKPKSILKANHLFRPTSDTPSKGLTVFDDDWANALQRTISPRKQDRRALRESQGDALRERGNNTASLAQSFGVRNTKATMSRMELMDSLFGETSTQRGPSLKQAERGIQV
jgi:nuclear pore complex protein Nup98-Nup96